MPLPGDYEYHPCEYIGCDVQVPFDDEPYCYTHSPDSGSHFPGYSYKTKHQDDERQDDGS